MRFACLAGGLILLASIANFVAVRTRPGSWSRRSSTFRWPLAHRAGGAGVAPA
jgi:hypothetical protein